MDERNFCDSIDCRFPYHDEAAWRTLIEQGAAISSEASFAVLHEICRKPTSVDIQPDAQHVMLNAWKDANTHALAETVAEAAACIIDDTPPPLATVLAKMDEVAAYPGMYSALNIVYCAWEWNVDDEHAVEERFARIRQRWLKAS